MKRFQNIHEYLNEPEEGGETTFTNVKTSEDNQLSIKPTLGRAVTWNNLYINGSSNFVTGGYTNPTFTIVQLSLRLGEHME